MFAYVCDHKLWSRPHLVGWSTCEHECSTGMAASVEREDEVKCGICLEQFQDPRSLPCLHSFCLECLQRSLDENTSLKCPMCRAKHELDKDCLLLLPVDQCALQQLPLRKLQQQQKEIVGDDKCGFCGEAATPVAWCSDCVVPICTSCLGFHKTMAYLKEHRIVPSKPENHSDSAPERTLAAERNIASDCLRHSGQDLKYLCTRCSETVCSDCLLMGPHKDHQYSTVEEARHDMETKMRGLMDSVVTKKEEFNEFLDKVGKIEGEAVERRDFMTKEVNNIFDGFVASVEAQREEALQTVSQGTKDIWAQKEVVEISLAQLDSFTHLAKRIQKCTTDSGYVSMAAHGIKLMERLESTCGHENVLDHKKAVIGSLIFNTFPLANVFNLGQPELQFSPEPGSDIPSLYTGKKEITIKVSLMVGDLPVVSKTMNERCELTVVAKHRFCYDDLPVEVKLVKSRKLSWKVNITVDFAKLRKEVTLQCKVSGGVTTIRKDVNFEFHGCT